MIIPSLLPLRFAIVCSLIYNYTLIAFRVIVRYSPSCKRAPWASHPARFLGAGAGRKVARSQAWPLAAKRAHWAAVRDAHAR